jgi:hypothetical protein
MAAGPGLVPGWEPVSKKIMPKQKKTNGGVPNQELLMVLCTEYLSDGGEKGFPWLR